MNKINVSILNESGLICDIVKHLLERDPEINFLNFFHTEKDFMDYLNSDSKNLDIILIEIESKNFNAFEIMTYLKENYPSIKSIVLTQRNDDMWILNSIAYGANSYQKLKNKAEDLIYAIHKVNSSEFCFTDKIISMMHERLMEMAEG